VLYLGVGGDLEDLRRLRDAVFRPPLERSLSWPWVPHVTVADEASEERIQAALVALDRYAAVVPISRIVLLEEDARVWRPLADAALGPPAVVGRGGLEVELTRGRLLDPEATALVEEVEEAVPQPFTGRREDPFPIVLTARYQGKAAAVGAAWAADDGAHVGVFVAPPARRQGLGGIVLAHLESAVRADGWDCDVLHACGPAGFYRARSAWALPERD
jgi:GNAT superfamily N-acetyltransferase